VTPGPASALLQQELAQEVRRQGIVVWLDRDASFTPFAAGLAERHAAGDFPYPVVGFKGSFLELLFALESHGSGYEKNALLIHMPGFNEDQIRETPMLELYTAGTRFRKALDTLIRQAATGRVAPDQVDHFVAGKPTLEQADTWLAEAVARPAGGLAMLLEASGPTLVVEALARTDSTLARQVSSEADAEVLKAYLHNLTGIDGDWFTFATVGKERPPVPRQPAIRSGCGARMAGNSTWCSRVGPRGRRSVPSLTGNSQTGQTSAINRRREDVGETAGTRAGQAARRSYRWCRPPSSGRATIFPMVGGHTSLGSGGSLLRDKCVRDL